MSLFAQRPKEEVHGIIIILAFAASRFLFFLKGGSFLAQPLNFAMQYLDPVLLKEDLLQSLLYLHSQPPLFNLLLGMCLKISPDPGLTYAVLFKTAGVVMPLALYGVLAGLGIAPGAALGAAVFFMLNPTSILYENFLYYTYPEAFFILMAIFFFLRWLTGKKNPDLFFFWAMLLCLGLVRSLFHPAFFLFIAGALGLYLYRRSPEGKKRWKKFIFSSSLVLVPLLFLCLKNFMLFGFFGTSSWDGMSLWIKANSYSRDALEELYSRGLISSLAVQAELETFRPLAQYPESEALRKADCHHPADCNEWKSTGKPNYNHAGYVALSRQLWKDALSLIKSDPGLFAFYTAGSYSLTLWYSSDSVQGLFEKNMEIVKRLESLYRFLYFGFLGVRNKHADPLMWLRTALITAFFVFFYAATIVNLLRKENRASPASAAVCLLCLLIHAYTLAVSSLIEFGENNRFRFPVDSAFLVLMAGNVMLWIKRLKKKGASS
ncbi:MAG: hypothetical protein WCQ99_04120 [Pseudomonadota bacterium]